MRGFCCFAGMWMMFAVLCPAQTSLPAPGPKPAAADVLVFANGDTLTGRLQGASGGEVHFHSDMAGDLTVPFSRVKELRSGGSFVALEAGKPGRYKAVAAGAVTVSGGQVRLTAGAGAGAGAGNGAGNETGAGQTLATGDLGFLIDAASYAREVDRRASLRTGWTGSATAGFTLVRSTESSTTFTGALNFVRQIPTVAYLPRNHRTRLDVTETYGTSRTPIIPPTSPPSQVTVVQTSIFHADAERDQYFSSRLYALADTSFEHNFASGLQLQQVYGTGVGWTPVQDARQELDVKADVHYERQEFIRNVSSPPPRNTKIVGSTFQENYRRNLPRRVVLTQWVNYLPAWNDLVAYSANAYVGVALPLARRLNVSLSATDNYLNNPAQFYQANTVQYVTGMSYTFK